MHSIACIALAQQFLLLSLEKYGKLQFALEVLSPVELVDLDPEKALLHVPATRNSCLKLALKSGLNTIIIQE